MPRSWWPEIGTCSSSECLINDLVFQIENRILKRGDPSLESNEIIQKKKICSACFDESQLLSFCSMKCKKKVMLEGHSRRCRFPPYRCGNIEIKFCNQILGLLNDEAISNQELDYIEADDDESSWESIESDDEDEQTYDQKNLHKTRLVTDFFEKYSYRFQRSDTLPFAAFYQEDSSSSEDY